MANNNIYVEDFYQTTLQNDLLDNGDLVITVANPPKNKKGFLILTPENQTTREGVYYNNVDGNNIYVKEINRRELKLHYTGEKVQINDTSLIFNYLSEVSYTIFYAEKTGDLSVKIWGGNILKGITSIDIADTDIILDDNITNYIYLDTIDNTIKKSNTPTGIVISEIVTSGGKIISINYKKHGLFIGNFIESIVKTSTNVLTDTYTITLSDGTTKTFDVTNGRGIESIVKTNTNVLTDTYTITYNDNTTSTYEVKNGRGIINIEKTNSSGLTDTYTITYNDNTTTTYEITNGQELVFKGDYGDIITYNKFDAVYYNNKSYVALQTTTGNNPTDTNYWQILVGGEGNTFPDYILSNITTNRTLDADNYTNDDIVDVLGTVITDIKNGVKGDKGDKGLNWVGSYDSNTVYNQYNAVEYQGNAYIAKTTTQGNKPTNTNYWDYFIGGNGIYENVTNKVTSFQTTPDDIHYPSEKLVKDSLDLKANLSGATFTGDVKILKNSIAKHIVENTTDGEAQRDLQSNGQFAREYYRKSDGKFGIYMPLVDGSGYLTRFGIKGDGNGFFDGGNFGIGTTTPTEKLDVNGRIMSRNSNIEEAGFRIQYAGFTGIHGTLTHRGNAGGLQIIAQTDSLDNSLSGDIEFHTSTSSDTATEKVIIKGNGNIGIGTTTPTEKLDVNGNIVNDFFVCKGNETTAGKFRLGGTGTDDDIIYLQFWSADESISASQVIHTGRYGANIPELIFRADKTSINGKINFSGLPTSSTGLSSGDTYIYDDGTRKYICIV